MILWRPTNNNQRYAFTPLLDAPGDDEEEDEQFVNDAFGEWHLCAMSHSFLFLTWLQCHVTDHIPCWK